VLYPDDPTPGKPSLPASAPRCGGRFFGSHLLLALVLFAASLTLFTQHNDFPYSYHPDETGKTGQIIQGSRNYHHPLLLLSATDIVSRLTFVPREPQAIVETGRWISAAFAAGAVVALALLAVRRYGPLAGWAAGLAMMLQVELFETAHYFKEDPALLFGLALSLLAVQVWWSAPSLRTLRFLGLACGVAAAGKYLGIVVLVFAVPLALWPAAGVEPADRRTRLKGFSLAFVAAFLICNLPLFATKLSSPFRSVGHEMKGVTGGHRGLTRQVPHGEYLESLTEHTPPAVLVLAGAYALILLATARRRTAPEWITLLFPLGYLAVLSCSPKIAGRYLLPVNVLLPFLGTLGAVEISRFIGGQASGARGALGLLALAGLAGAQIYGEIPPLQKSFAGFQQDDHAAVAAWIRTNLPPDAVIAEDHRVNLSPTKANGVSKNARVPQKVFNANFAPDLGTLDELRAMGVTHVAICQQSYRRYFRDETKPREGARTAFDHRREFYAEVLEQGELLREWPPGTISYLQPGIRLYRVAPLKN